MVLLPEQEPGEAARAAGAGGGGRGAAAATAAAAAPGGGSVEALRTIGAELTADGTGSVVLAPPPLPKAITSFDARVAAPNCGGAWAWACGGPASGGQGGSSQRVGRALVWRRLPLLLQLRGVIGDGWSLRLAPRRLVRGLAPRCEVSSSGGGVDSDALGARGITGRAPGINAAGLNLRFEASAATPPPPARLLTSEEPTCCGGSSSPSLSLLLSPLLSLLSAGGLGGGGGAIARGGPGERRDLEEESSSSSR